MPLTAYVPLDGERYRRHGQSTPFSVALAPGSYVYVQDCTGMLWVAPDGPHVHPRVLGGARPVVAAGELTLGENGEVLSINNLSGTFRCSSDCCSLPSEQSSSKEARLKPGQFLDMRFEMKSELLIADDKLALVDLTNGDRCVRLSLWLAEEFTGGDLARFGREATVTLQGMDELSSSYSPANWLSGVASGALYAFRTLCIPRQRIVVAELSGCLGSADMEVIAIAAAVTVSTLANRPLPKLGAKTWTIKAGLAERSPSDSDAPGDVVERPH